MARLAIMPIDNNTVISVAIGGDRFRTTLGSFVECQGGIEIAEVQAALAKGETYRGGGGAGEEFELWRAN